MRIKNDNPAKIYTGEFNAKLTKRYGEYKNGSVKMISSVKSKKRIQALLQNQNHQQKHLIS